MERVSLKYVFSHLLKPHIVARDISGKKPQTFKKTDNVDSVWN